MTSVGLSHRRAIIVGAGQTGLAVAAELISRGLRPQQDFVMIDAAPPGHRSWRTRWHSMELLSSARHSGLTVRPVPGDPHRHPRADEIADYLHTVEGELGVTPVWGVLGLAGVVLVHEIAEVFIILNGIRAARGSGPRQASTPTPSRANTPATSRLV